MAKAKPKKKAAPKKAPAKKKEKVYSADPMEATLERMRERNKKSKTKLMSEGTTSDILGVIPTGIDVLDHHVLGIGGLPAGRLMEVYSGEGVGKTSFLCHVMGKVQELGGIAALAETEAKIDSKRAEVFGVDLKRVLFEEPDTIEDTLLWVQDFLHSLPDAEPDSPPHFVGWDSLAASPTADEFKIGIEAKDQVGGKSKLMSKACRVIPRLAVKKKAHFLVVNQTRANIGVMFGPSKVTPGGAAFKFASTLRLSLWSGKVKLEGEYPVGKIVNFKATKNQVSIPGREMGIYLDYRRGFDNLRSTIVHAKDMGCIAKAAKYNEKTLQEAREALGWV